MTQTLSVAAPFSTPFVSVIRCVPLPDNQMLDMNITGRSVGLNVTIKLGGKW
jgi:hypothetical protein